MILDEKVYEDFLIGDFLEHHGIKGQKWGIRNQREKLHNWGVAHPKAKKAIKWGAIIGGSAAIAAGAAYAAYRFKTPISGMSHAVEEKGKAFAEKTIHEPHSIIHASRGKEAGFRFLQRGGLEDPVSELEKVGGDAARSAQPFRRFGTNNEKVFAMFDDPLGRKDAAGRIIPHEVILPKGLSENVHSVEDAKKVAWPLIKDDFEALYKKARHA